MITAERVEELLDCTKGLHSLQNLPQSIFLDYETVSEEDLIKNGIDLYMHDVTTGVLMVSWCEDRKNWYHWNVLKGEFPARLKNILEDKSVIKHAFNAQFERLASKVVLGFDIGYEDWRCTMCHAYMMGFSGTLDMVGQQVGVSLDHAKMKEGKDLIKFFSCPVPERSRKSVGGMFRKPADNLEKFRNYCRYNVRDVVSEMAIDSKINRESFPILPSEWRLYAIDQIINDQGVPVDIGMAKNALDIRDTRKKELVGELKRMTGLSNPNSTAQLLPWLKERGYPFNDVQSASIKTALKRFPDQIQPEAIAVMKKRRWASATSPAKYSAILTAQRDGRFRYSLQFSGAQRTQRWGGRRVQTQNLPRTPKCIEPNDGDISKLNITTEIIRAGKYDELCLWMTEPMEAVVGCIRSAFRAEKGHEFRVVDLASIESVVIGWVTNCQWFQEVLAKGQDIYKSFAMHLYHKAYEEVTKAERNMAKPATLGCGYRLGGGFETDDYKRTGLWGYAENMGVDMTQSESINHVAVFRELCGEIKQYWFDLERAAERCITRKMDVQCGKVTFEYRKPFMAIRLPSGRRLYYFQPKLVQRDMVNPQTGESWSKIQISYMGQDQKSKKWSRQYTHGGKLVENIVQAIARDVLKAGLMRAHLDGFEIVMHVHDEIVTHARIDNTYHTVERLLHLMTAPIKWAEGMHLGGAGWAGPFYMKD